MGSEEFSKLLQLAITKERGKAYGLEIFIVEFFSKSLTLLSEKHQCEAANGDFLYLCIGNMFGTWEENEELE